MRFVALLTVLGAAQVPRGVPPAKGVTGGVRFVEVRAEPAAPSFGRPFNLQVTLRVRPGVIAFLPDTLVPAPAVQSMGRGVWSEAPAAGDSVEIRATYPVIAFGEGRVVLPAMEVWTRPAGAGDPKGAGVVRRAFEVPAGTRARAERRLVRLGAVEVAPIPAMADSDAALVARPPADVLGRQWSLPLILAVGLASILGLFGLWVLARRWREGVIAARSRHGSPRQEALRELERIRAVGWHRNGRVDDFYASSTGALRHFAARTDPSLGAALTSTELLARMAVRWPGSPEVLGPTVAVAERVKFGALRPDGDTAEVDWQTIFSWIRDTPEG